MMCLPRAINHLRDISASIIAVAHMVDDCLSEIQANKLKDEKMFPQ